MMENERKEIKTRQANLEKLKEKLSDLKFSRNRSRKYCFDRKWKLETLDEIMKNKVTRKGTVRRQKVDSAELIETICRIFIPGSAMPERRSK